MKSSFILFLALLIATVKVSAQSYTIKGNVTDTLNSSSLRNASVTLLRANDSILETFTRSKDDGSFILHPRKTGNYILIISYPSFAEFIDVVKIIDETIVDVGQIPMISKSHLLQEVVLTRQVSAIKIKGDTTEYVADSFKVKENATVEDLLKKLPGLQVDRNGQITAQGEKVEKVLVDGEEFFSDDPAVVTRNLQAKAVDKVQIFDKKSEQAEFTGIDDGEKSKTVNLQLKEDAKKGYFGKIIASGGTSGHWEEQGMINMFKGKRKLAAFAIASNTGKVGLGWDDRDKFGSGNNSFFDSETGNYYSYFNSDDELGTSWSGSYNGEGLPKVFTGGLHYSDKWHGDTMHFSGNYRYAKQDIETTGNTLIQYNLPGGTSYYTDETKLQNNTAQRHSGDGMFEWKYDSLSTLKLTAGGGYSETKTSADYQTDSKDSIGKLLNNSTRKINNDISSKNINATLEWKKKFAKKGRTLLVTADEKYKVTNGIGYLNSTNKFYSNNTIINAYNIDQKKTNNTELFLVSAVATYTEPLSKEIFLELDYGIALNNSSAEKISYDKSIGDNYDVLNAVNSSSYDFNVLTNKAGSKLKFVYKKINFSFGGNVGYTNFSHEDKLNDTSFTRQYTNFFPQAAFSYKLNKQASFSMTYNGSTTQPTIEQIQPLQQNTDPLNIAIGNPDLKQKFSHQVYLRYNNYKVISGTYSYLGGGVTFYNNDISRSESISSNGVRTYQYVNVNGNYAPWGYGGYGFKLKKIEVNINLHGNINLNHFNNFVNGATSSSNNNVYSMGINMSHYKEKKWNIELNPNISYNNIVTTNTEVNKTNFWSSHTDFTFSYDLPAKFEFGTDVDYTWRERTVFFDRNNNVFQWNAYVSKKFFKKDQLEVRLSAFDILNQNIGYRRFGNGNTIVENNYNTIRRYGLLSITYNFNKSPASNPE